MEDAISFNNYYTRHLPKTYYTTKCGATGASSREMRQTSFGQAHHSIGADGHMSPVQAPFTAPNSRLRGSYEASCGTHLLKDSSANIPKAVNTGQPEGLDQNWGSSLWFCPRTRGSYEGAHAAMPARVQHGPGLAGTRRQGGFW